MKMSESGSKTRVDRKSDSDAVEVTCSRFTRIVGFPRSPTQPDSVDHFLAQASFFPTLTASAFLHTSSRQSLHLTDRGPYISCCEGQKFLPAIEDKI